MDWIHEVSKEWMLARKKYLTATEAISLITESKKYNGSKLGPVVIGLWGEKNSIEEPDTVSHGPAARGHKMEPFALEIASRWTGIPCQHYDDIIITNGNIGFSPDGMDIVAENFDYGTEINYHKLKHYESEKPTIFEAKCYSARKHTQKCMEADSRHEERFQIAYSMIVDPEIQQGVLVFYNPDCKQEFSVSVYPREDLVNEIKLLSDVVIMWNDCCEMMDAEAEKFLKKTACFDVWHTTKEIHDLTMPDEHFIV